MRSRTAQTRGYTLIELIMVMAVLALAAALLVPQLVSSDSMTVQAAVRLIIADLSFAQSDALANQEYRRVLFYDDGRGYCLFRVTDSDYATPADLDTADYIFDPLGAMGRYIVDFTEDDRFEGVTIESVDIDGGAREVTYDALGGTVITPGVPGNGGEIIISFDAERYQIDIAPFTGKLTVSKL
ncbi:MAG: prepilin-type N-terminal cleavage/methylation domain-containing protein [Planctomycetota bacterium]|jgi:prepilin-type N-terminal cleavage/methylation domain-containing protein